KKLRQSADFRGVMGIQLLLLFNREMQNLSLLQQRQFLAKSLNLIIAPLGILSITVGHKPFLSGQSMEYYDGCHKAAGEVTGGALPGTGSRFYFLPGTVDNGPFQRMHHAMDQSCAHWLVNYQNCSSWQS
ncbi:MAG: hypothetical protein OEZ23_08620, partial [Gammaproteobacteria bacterium]|nr:hypothetical protein [Gammaproteobacteria bacterium]